MWKPPPALRDRLIGAALFILTVVSVMATNDMGYTRDESFYFRYGRSYAEWFAAIDQAKTAQETHAALGRESTVATWSGNFEHPPLMKTAFAGAWRHLSWKDRSLVAPADASSDLRLTGLARADGFEVGAIVDLLAPLESRGSPKGAERALGRAEVTERTLRGATLRLTEGDRQGLAQACVRPDRKTPGADLPITGCQGREVRALALLSEVDSMRLVGALTAAFAVLFTFLLGAATFGWIPGLLAALLFLWTPRHFFHAHLICFDMGIVAAMMATLYGFWRSREDRRWALATGLLWGVALLIKHNAFFMPVPLLAFWIWSDRSNLKFLRNGWRVRVKLPPVPVALFPMVILGPVMLFVFWPRLWFDPWAAVSQYFAFHLHHEHYFQWFQGQPFQVPPFPVTFPTALTVLTVPVPFLLLTVAGVWLRFHERRSLEGAERSSHAAQTDFLLLNGLVPLLLISLPNTPIFGGIKHWMTGMPLLFLFGGLALARCGAVVSARWRGSWRASVAAVALVALVLVPPAISSIRGVAYGSGAYNALVAGSFRGGADDQLMRMYWGHTSRQAMDWINAKAPANARVFFQNTTPDAFEMYRREGELRHDLRYAAHPGAAQVALIEPQKSFAELDMRVRRAFGVAGPQHVVRVQGVPMLRLYLKP